MAMEATIDNDQLTNQPATYRVNRKDDTVDYAADGTPIVSKRASAAGDEIEWEWGDVVDPATVAELLSARSGKVLHTIYFRDKSDNEHSYSALWLADPSYESGGGITYRPLTVKFIVVSGGAS